MATGAPQNLAFRSLAHETRRWASQLPARYARHGRLVRRRLDLLSSELTLNRDRTRGWGVVHALAWGLTDEGVHAENVACADLLAVC